MIVKKRIPLFILGLLYGALINSVVLGLGYGLYVAGRVALGILSSMGPVDGECALLLLGLIAILGIVGFAAGVVYGTFAGAWHCGMDFYNNGFLRGLTSPFRFLSAKWSSDISGKTDDLAAYYASTDVSFFEKKRQAEQRIIIRAQAVDVLVNKAMYEKLRTQLPFDLGQHIAGFESSKEMTYPNNNFQRGIANIVEKNIVAQKNKTSPTTVGDHFSSQEIVTIIKNCKPKNGYRIEPTVQLQPQAVPSALEIVRRCRRGCF